MRTNNTRTRRRATLVAVGALLALGLLAAAPPDARAFKVTDPIVYTASTGALSFNGSATLGNNTSGTAANVTGTVAIANGGTGQTGATAAFDALDPLTTKGDILSHNGTNSVRRAVGTDGQVLTADSAQADGIKWATPATGVSAVVWFASEGPVDLNASTVYIGPSGRVSATENEVMGPMQSGTLANLICMASGTVGGTSLTLTLGSGTCGAGLTYTATTQEVAPTSTTPVEDVTGSVTIGTNGCVALKAVAAGDTNSVFVTCSAEKTT